MWATSSNGKAGTGLANCTVFLGSGGKFKTNTFSTTVQADINDVNSSYHALQLSAEKRTTHGLTVLANYTYSKSLDDLPFGEGVSGFDTGYSALPFNDPNRHRFDYGPSGFDHTHLFVASYVWRSPNLKSSSSLLRHLLGDYELGGILSAATGRPITVLQGAEISGTGIGNDRADGQPEWHETEADVFIATLLVGGTLVGGETTAPHEKQNGKIEGGIRQKLSVGDVVRIPPRVPHQLLLDGGKEFGYFVIKVKGY